VPPSRAAARGWNAVAAYGSLAPMVSRKSPPPEAVAEAAQHPGGWLYEIGSGLGPDDPAPPEAVVGAWKVSPEGQIVGDFIPNPTHDAKRWPAKP
jgi:hypothetical protein